MKRKSVVLCGSMKFIGLMQEMAERMELEQGWVVLSVTPHVLERSLSEEELALLGEIHLARIDLADAVYVVNPGGYIGQSVQREIEYAHASGKELIYLENPFNQGG